MSYISFKNNSAPIFAFLLLIFFSPTMIIISVAIIVTSGFPIFYVQNRLGKNGVIFQIYKFRSMHNGSSDLRNGDGTTFASPMDKRVTSLGRILRSTSLDELPQLLNVVLGDMCLIGPRPELPEAISTHTSAELPRLNVKPGLTGLAQISGRKSLEIRQRRKIDAVYAQTVSLNLDLKILIRTFVMIITRKDAF